MAVPVTNVSTISVRDLCIESFVSRPHLQQLQIVTLGRPLKNASQISYSEGIPASITPLLFQQVQWLTYCDHWKDFFCWPCLLFMPHFQSSEVKIKASADLKNILIYTDKHETTEDHLTCSLKLQMFISENFPPPVSKDKVSHNCVVKKNRDVFKCMTDAVCCVVGQNLLESDGKYSFNQISIDDCKKFLLLLKGCNPWKAEAVDGAFELMSSNSRIANHLVDAMTRSLKIMIKNETKKSSYVSIILSQHGSSRGKSQMSTVLRYVSEGKICERFVGFTNHVGVKTRDQLMECIRKLTEEYDIADRFLAVSLDGVISYGQSLSLLIPALSITYGFSYFVPWHSHGFGHVLLQTLSIYRECGVFLKMVSGIQDFFRNEKHFNKLKEILRQKIYHYTELHSMKWNLHSNFILYVAKYRCYFIQCFGNVISNSRRQKNIVVSRALAFRSFLQDFRNVFLLRLFYDIFHDFDETFNLRFERDAFNLDKMAEFKNRVVHMNFVKIFIAVKAEAENEKGSSFARWIQFQATKWEVLFKTLIRHLSQEIDTRCSHLLTRLSFCDIFDRLRDCPSDPVFTFTQAFHDLQKQMMAEHGDFFKDSDFRVEANAIKSDLSLREKTVYELLEHFAKYDLRELFPQSYKLVEFILTLPYLPARRQAGEVSKLEDIRKFSYFPPRIGIPSGDVSFLGIEYEMLRSLRQTTPFYDDVIARFYEVIKTIPLLQM